MSILKDIDNVNVFKHMANIMWWKETRTELPLQASACSSYQPDLLLMSDKTAKQVVCFHNHFQVEYRHDMYSTTMNEKHLLAGE